MKRRLSIAPPVDGRQDSIVEVDRAGAFNGAGGARGHCGRFVEQVVRSALGLREIRIDGRYDVCFDAYSGGVYFEIKSLRCNSKCPLYCWRIQKDIRASVPVVYLFALHRAKEFDTFADLYTKLLPSLNAVHALTVAEVKILADAEPVVIPTNSGKRNGYNRKGYRDGYRNVPAAAIFKAACYHLTRRPGHVDGHEKWIDVIASRRAYAILAEALP